MPRAVELYDAADDEDGGFSELCFCGNVEEVGEGVTMADLKGTLFEDGNIQFQNLMRVHGAGLGKTHNRSGSELVR